MVGPLGETGGRLGHAEIEQQDGTHACLRWLGESAAQQDGFGLRSTLLAGRAGCLDQALDHPVIGGGLAQEQVLGDALARARLLGQQSRRAAVTSCALDAGEVCVDPAAHDRMDERQRPPRLDDPGRGQQLGRRGRLCLVQIGEPRRLQKLALLEDGQGLGEPAGMLGQAAELETNGAADRSRSDALDIASGVRRRGDSSLPQRIDEDPQQERAAARLAETGVDEERIRDGVQRRFDELRDARSAQRGEPDQIGARVPGQRREQLGVGSDLLRPSGQHERDVQLLQAREQEGQVAKRGGVRPVGVVDDQADGTGRRKIGAQPVEAVEDGERDIQAQRRKVVGRRGAWEIEDARRRAGRRVQQLAPLELGCLRQRRLEELADDAESELALELGSPRAQHPHPARGRRVSRRSEHRRLPDPGRPFQHHEPASPGARLGQGGIDSRELVDPFEKPCPERLARQMPSA